LFTNEKSFFNQAIRTTRRRDENRDSRGRQQRPPAAFTWNRISFVEATLKIRISFGSYKRRPSAFCSRIYPTISSSSSTFATQWRWQLGVAAIPSILFLVMLYGIPRSSRWPVTQNKTDEAFEVLKMMGSPDSEAELREIMDSIHMEGGMAAEPLFKRRYCLPIFLAITTGLFNQLSGINAILYYSNFIFAAASFSQISGTLQNNPIPPPAIG
jgi:Sugar (and other) transporter